MENWKALKNYELYYEVSDLGRIKRKNGKVLKESDNGNGYKTVSPCVNSISKKKYVHRLVASSFIDNAENKKEVNHIDGDTSNNKLSNLEWVTRSENHIHRYKVLKRPATNKGKFGAKNWNSKRVAMYKNGILIQEYAAVMEASRILNVNEASIRSCIYGKSKTCLGHTFKYLS